MAVRLTERRVSMLTMAAFVVIFAAMRLYSVSLKSATFDEPVHLTAGYAALTRGDFRLDPSHPPFLRMWAALPLLAGPRPTLNLSSLDAEGPESSAFVQGRAQSRQFVFADNDADSLLWRGRLMSLVWAMLLGVLVFLWMREWLGLRIAVPVLLFYTVSPNLSAHAPLITTDAGATCFMFAAVYFLWRTCREFSAVNVGGVVMATALAVVSKFSGLILAPILTVLVVVALASHTTFTIRRAVVLAGLTISATWLAIWAVYGFRYAPSDVPGWTFQSISGANATGIIPAAVEWLDRQRVLPNAFTHGVWLSGSTARLLPVYLGGQISHGGWWYYFPLAFLLKTPTAALALLVTGIAAIVLRWRRLGALTLLFAAIPPVLYFAVAMASGINMGVRHILPVLPFYLLLAGTGAELLMRDGGRVGRAALAVLMLGWVVEFGRVYPNSLTFFNVLAGGPEQGGRYLTDSNLDWGQHLKLLKRWMDRQQVSHVNLAYFGSGDPAYYGINATRLPGEYFFNDAAPERPVLPGFVAIGETARSGVYLPRHLQRFYAGFDALKPVAVIANSLRIYWIDVWPEPDHFDSTGPDGPESLRALADFLRVLPSPNHASRHYREYLALRPDDASALEGLGRAAIRIGDFDAAREALTRALGVDPSRASALEALATADLRAGRVAAAIEDTERLCDLAPRDPASHDLRGRALAAGGRVEEAIRAFEYALELNPGFAPAREALRLLRRSA